MTRLEGRSTVNKQYIEDLANASDLKQPERDLIRNLLKSEGKDVKVVDFANKVKTELLPLEVASSRGGSDTARFESVNLPDELRGPVANYEEKIYASPIKTSAGNVHFSDDVGAENYFAHTRVEDLPTEVPKGSTIHYDNKGTTRRVIELQSDLFQKGRLEAESPRAVMQMKEQGYNVGELGENKIASRNAEIAKLEPYRNTWQDRVIREEVKQAAVDGKTKLQFPTGETAMKIEGLGDQTTWHLLNEDESFVRPEDLKVGETIASNNDNQWVITHVYDEPGKFDALPRSAIDNMEKQLSQFGSSPDDAINALMSGDKNAYKILGDSIDNETFDISGKVDKENPIYKFYEKEVGRYLKNKFGATQITDPQGVSWYEVNVPKDAAKLPIEAFGIVPIAALGVGSQQ